MVEITSANKFRPVFGNDNYKEAARQAYQRRKTYNPMDSIRNRSMNHDGSAGRLNTMQMGSSMGKISDVKD